jgi:hypothetical protein
MPRTQAQRGTHCSLASKPKRFRTRNTSGEAMQAGYWRCWWAGGALSLHPSSPPFHLPLNLEATWCSGSSPGQYLILCEAHRDQKKVRWAQKPVPGPKSSSQQDMASAQDSRTQGCSPPGPAPPSGIAGPWDVCKRLSLQHTSCS